jgi:hypothetical protein
VPAVRLIRETEISMWKWIVMAGFSLACNGGGGEGIDNWEPATLADQGEVCFEGLGADASVTVWADTCLSSSCSRAASGTCEATLLGSTITVTSTFEWETNNGTNVPCTDDCGSITAKCEVTDAQGGAAEVVAGDYTVEHGDTTTSETVPTEACAD